jgi:ABC-type arginine/histidine transport system permease subunit
MKGARMLALLAFQMISPLVIMAPLYRCMNWLGLVDTHFCALMVYVALGCPLACWLLKGAIDAIPGALDEAAMRGGCWRFSLFWRTIVPLAVLEIASVFIIGNRWLVAVSCSLPAADPDRPHADRRRHLHVSALGEFAWQAGSAEVRRNRLDTTT